MYRPIGNKNRKIGAEAEKAALIWLFLKGYKYVATNYTVKGGEVDIIVRNREYLVFVEVKCRKEGSMVSPSEAVDEGKKERMIRTANAFIAQSGGQYGNLQPRFDVLTLQLQKNGRFKFSEHIQNAF